jgi:Skp family chaperone for outer membrane proteins
MATLKQAIQAKLDAAQQEVASLQAALADAETTFTEWVDQEVEEIKAKAEALVAELDKYL